MGVRLSMKKVGLIAPVIWVAFVTFSVVEQQYPDFARSVNTAHAAPFKIQIAADGGQCKIHNQASGRNLATAGGYGYNGLLGISSDAQQSAAGSVEYLEISYQWAKCDAGWFVAAARIRNLNDDLKGAQMEVLCCPLNF